MLMMAMTTRSSISVKARSQAFSRWEQEIVRVLIMLLLGTVGGGFMISMLAKKRTGGLSMNLPRPSNRSLSWKSGAEDARTPDASRLPGVSEPREASGVRPIYRRFPSAGGTASSSWSQCMRKSKGARHEPQSAAGILPAQELDE